MKNKEGFDWKDWKFWVFFGTVLLLVGQWFLVWIDTYLINLF